MSCKCGAFVLLFIICNITTSIAFIPVEKLPLSPIETAIQTLENKALQEYLKQHSLKTLDEVPDRIIGGIDAKKDDAPFLVLLFRRFLFQNRYLCGGSLISPRTVLTAAHCVSNFYNYRIRYGTHKRMASRFEDMEVAEMKPHPKFEMRTVRNDIALFILKKAIQPSSNVQTVKWATNNTDTGTNATLFGFGLKNGRGKSPAITLQKTTLTILDEDECIDHIAKLNIEKGPGMFCASAPDRSACNGDSGGPLVDTETGKQIGIVSFGTRFCPAGSVNVYTNVSYYMDWINKNKVD